MLFATQMAIFNLPSTRVPAICPAKASSDTVYINESLQDYIEQLKHMKNESYSKLASVCGLRHASTLFFKYLEVFQSFPFQRTAIRVQYLGETNSDAQKALKIVRGGTDDVATAEAADLIVGEAANGLWFGCVYNALMHQKRGGSLILHVGDLFNAGAVQLLYLIAACYTSVCVYTPMMNTGQTKFIVASQLHQNIELTAPPPYHFTPSQLFLTKLIEINTMIGQKRLEQTRFNTTCEYECIIWKSKFLTGLHNMDFDADGGGNQVQERSKAAHGDAVD